MRRRKVGGRKGMEKEAKENGSVEGGRMEEGDRNEMPHVCICVLIIAYYLQTANMLLVVGIQFLPPYINSCYPGIF